MDRLLHISLAFKYQECMIFLSPKKVVKKAHALLMTKNPPQYNGLLTAPLALLKGQFSAINQLRPANF